MTPEPNKLALADMLDEYDDPKLYKIINELKSGYYNEWNGGKLDSPIATLVSDLLKAGHPAIANRCVNGEWDDDVPEPPEDESDD